MSLLEAQNVVLASTPEIDARLICIFKAIEAADIQYCLLRGYHLLWTQGTKEIDLLVLPEHIPTLKALLAARGFGTLPAWGHAPHQFFVSYNSANDSWLKIDVVNAVRYGDPVRALEVDITRNLLLNRRRYPYTYLPAPEEEFLKLLLHCILHKREFSPEKSRRLLQLAREVANRPGASRNLSRHVATYLFPTITNSMLALMAITGHYEPLLKTRSEVLQRLFWASPVKNSWRYFSTKSLAVLRPVLMALFRRGITIALLAPDGAGKTTLARKLAEDPFIRAQVIYMGCNSESQSSNFRVANWLRRRFPQHFGRDPRQNRPFTFRLLNYLLSLAEHWYRIGLGLYHKLRGRFVVFDRYMYDSWLNPQTASKKPLRDRLFDLVWLKTDMVIVLDAPGQILYERKLEHSPEWLEERRRQYVRLGERLPEAVFVNAARPEDEVHREVVSLIWKEYVSRAR